MLSAPERARAAQFRQRHDRDAYAARRGQLRRVLALYLGSEPSEVQLEEAAGGKPRLATTTGGSLSFNMSTSADLVVIAVAPRGEVGVDVEEESSAPSLGFALLDELGPTERAYIARQNNALGLRSANLRCWTGREAVVKACGTGLRTPLDSFEVDPDTGRVTDHSLRAAMPTAVKWFSPAAGYIAALSIIPGR